MNKSLFSFSIETKDYTVITLSAENLLIKIAPGKGSNMFAMKYGNHDIIFSDKAILDQAGFTGTYVLFPTPNRVKDFTYLWKGKKHVLKKNGKTVNIHHQLVFDQRWQFAKPVIYTDHVSVRTSITIDESSSLFEGFPFANTLTLEYNLYPDKVQIIYTVKNLGKEELPFGFGLHPHFARLSGNTKTMVTIPAKSVMENYEGTMLPDGKLAAVKGPTDIRKPTPVGDLNLDHVFTDIMANRYAQVDYTTLGFKVILKASEDFTHLVCWSGHQHAICIENQTCSTDAHNLWARGFKKESHLLLIAPGKSKSGFVSYVIQPY